MLYNNNNINNNMNSNRLPLQQEEQNAEGREMNRELLLRYCPLQSNPSASYLLRHGNQLIYKPIHM